MSNYNLFKLRGRKLLITIIITALSILSITVIVIATLYFNFNLFSNAGSQDEIFVSPNGSDSNTGKTLQSPFKSVNKAVSVAVPGSIISMRSGTYYETLSLDAGGTSTKPITIRSYPGETAILDGSKASGSDLNLLKINSSAQYILVDGIVFDNSKDRGIKIEGSNITIQNSTIKNSKSSAFITKGVKNIKFLNNKVYNNVLVNESPTSIYRQQGGGWPATVVFWQSSGFLASGNKVYNNYGEGILCWYQTSDCVISDNEVFDNHSVNIYFDAAKNSVIERNLIYKSDSKSSWGNAGISIADELGLAFGGNNVVSNNIILNVSKGVNIFQYKSGFNQPNTQIVNNTLVNNSEGSLRIHADPKKIPGLVFSNNIIYHKSGYMVDVPDIKDADIDSNLFYSSSNNQADKIALYNNSKISLKDFFNKNTKWENFWGDPQFVNLNGLSAESYLLKSSSPAVSRATSRGITADYFSNSRSDTSDIGALKLNSDPSLKNSNMKIESLPTASATPTKASTPEPTSTPTPITTPTATSTPTSTPTNKGSVTTDITVYAKGYPAKDSTGKSLPDMQLLVNDVIIYTWKDIASDSTKPYTYTYTGLDEIKIESIKVQFPNDYYNTNTKQDRDLKVDKIVLSYTYETESPSTYSTGMKNSKGECTPGYQLNERLACTGYIKFK